MKRVAFVLVLALAACGGGGSTGGGAPVLPTPRTSPSTAPPAAADVTFALNIPAAAAATAVHRTRPLDFTAATSSVSIVLSGKVLTTADVSAASKLCTAGTGGGRTCNIGVNVPAASSDRFTITAYDQPNGTGNAIASGDVATTVPTTSNKPVPVTVAGVAATLRISLLNAYPPAGKVAQSAIVVQEQDIDGNTILGPYAQPVTLTDSDTSSVTKLSTTTIANATSTAMLSYSGTTFSNATIQASVSGTPSVSATFAPLPTPISSWNVPNVQVGPRGETPGVVSLVLGPDGNMWSVAETFAEVVKLAPDGTQTAYPLPSADDYPTQIVAGGDGNLWFAENSNGAIGRITPSGTITEFSVPYPPNGFSEPQGVGLGPDGNVWFTDVGQSTVGKITPSGTITQYPLPNQGAGYDIISGPNANLWITDQSNNAIVEMTTSGQVVGSFKVPLQGASPYGLAEGADGNVWFADFGAQAIGKVTPAGQVTEYKLQLGNTGPISVTKGPDGNMWFADMGQEVAFGHIGYITPDGKTIREFLPHDGLHVNSVAFDKNKLLWYAEGTAGSGGGLNEFGTLMY